MSREEVRSIATSFADSFHRSRRQVAQAAWDGLTPENRGVVHALMQATLHRFTLERIAEDRWQGSLYEANRLEVMASHNMVTFPPHLHDVAAYLKTFDLLAEYPEEIAEQIVAELHETV